MSLYKYLELFNIGIKVKLRVLILFSSILPVILMGYYGYYFSIQTFTDNIRTQDKQNVENIVIGIQSFLNKIPEHLNFLVDFYSFNKLNTEESYTTWLKNPTQEFKSFIYHQKIYKSLQIIATDGKEVLRINYDNNQANIVVENKLHNQQNNDYFIKTINLKKRHIVNLPGFNNIHYSIPIIDKNHITQGILVLSLNSNHIINYLHTFKELENTNFHYLLLDQNNKLLYHIGDESENHEQHLPHEKPSELFTITNKQRGTIESNNIITTFQKFQLSKEFFWILIKQTDKNFIFSKAHYFKQVFLIEIILVFVLSLLISHWFTNIFIAPLLAVNQHLRFLAHGNLAEGNIEYNKNDEIGELVISTWQLKNNFKNTIAQANAIAAGNYSKKVTLLSDQDQLGRALANMTHTLDKITTQNKMQDWFKTGQTKLNDKMSGEQDIATLTRNIINFITPYLKSQIGLLYLVEDEQLKLVASYAFTRRKNLANKIDFGEGLVGQAALEGQPILISQVPKDYIHIQSGLGEAIPKNILVMPFKYEKTLKGIIEIGSFETITNEQMEFIQQIVSSIAIAINTSQSRTQMQDLLLKTQTQTEELRSQAEELQTQQEELRQTNEELEERTIDLERQKDEIRDKNLTLEATKKAIETKAKEVELASKYKSEFLANMSHELRTPLNSLLILAQLLADNKTSNLNQKQIEYAQTIHSAGSDLLKLINDILDLSKVEAGKVEIQIESISLVGMIENIEQKFRPVAESKGIIFHISIDENMPKILNTDGLRLKQIINNLLSNAFKFTHEGEVNLSFSYTNAETIDSINLTGNILIISVVDTGIGIPKNKQKSIFGAFQQADGTTSRRYGGTGLGLSISRQLAGLLGGELQLVSEDNKGSTFSLYLPQKNNSEISDDFSEDVIIQDVIPKINPEIIVHNDLDNSEVVPKVKDAIPDDRENINENDKSILIVEDDRKFSQILLDLSQEKGFKCLVAENGIDGLQLATQYKPNAIILDIGLPQIDGWTVMERLKDNSDTRHIPVHFMSASDSDMDAKKMGAIGFLHKPISMIDLSKAFKKIEQFLSKTMKNLLVVVDNRKIIDLFDGSDVKATLVTTLNEALQKLKIIPFECIIVEIANTEGIKLLENLYNDDNWSQIPVIIYANRELKLDEETILNHFAETLTVKTVRSPERLLDEATLFLHQVESKLPTEKRNMLQMVHNKEAILRHKKVLLVDDDVRNIFALATILEEREMEVVIGQNGQEALDLLAEHQDISIILMDIMMPEMDGYEAMRQIRLQERLRKIPIIALTAKAMKGDKAKCIDAGANDYLSKPFDSDKLVSLMRVWLYQ
ncbi:MAG: response regulator [Candidatus Marithrix sp.]